MRIVLCILMCSALLGCGHLRITTREHPDEWKTVTCPQLSGELRVPKAWGLHDSAATPFYSYGNWQNDNNSAAVGVVHVTMPLPISKTLLMSLFKSNYKGKDGRVVAEWSDPDGRQWFIAEDKRFHVEGYVEVHGRQAWVVYHGNNRIREAPKGDIETAAQCAASFHKTVG